jgi:hypothetical protein
MKFKIEGRYTASIIGSLFMVIFFISTFTIVIPILTTLVLPVILEFIFSLIIHPSEYEFIEIGVLICLSIIFILTSYSLFRFISRNKEPIKNELFKYFTIQVFIIPSIFFYVDALHDLDRVNDGQYFFVIFELFPLSSFSFLFLGIIIDLVRNITTKQNIKRGRLML